MTEEASRLHKLGRRTCRHGGRISPLLLIIDSQLAARFTKICITLGWLYKSQVCDMVDLLIHWKFRFRFWPSEVAQPLSSQIVSQKLDRVNCQQMIQFAVTTRLSSPAFCLLDLHHESILRKNVSKA